MKSISPGGTISADVIWGGGGKYKRRREKGGKCKGKIDKEGKKKRRNREYGGKKGTIGVENDVL